MSLKLNLKGHKPSHDGSQASPPPPTPTATGTGTGTGFKLKLSSVPSTPVNEYPGSAPLLPPSEAPARTSTATKAAKPAAKKTAAKKRTANDDSISSTPKRVATNASARRLSIKPPTTAAAPRPPGTGGTVKVKLSRRTASVPKLVGFHARGRAPPRPKGVGYDSEDSEAEADPAVQQAFILRMPAGAEEDAAYLREAIANGRVGPNKKEGDAEVSLKFVDRTLRRAVVKVRGHTYAAVLVDLPCIVETMKSFDKKGWWKVADMAQMLLVLGRCATEEEAKTAPLPREVDKNTLQYAHGLTPPLHWVKKRRFRKRINHTDIRNVEEEVERLLAEDRQYEEGGGSVILNLQDRAGLERVQTTNYDDEEDEEDEEDDAIETVEMDGQEQYDDEDEDGEGEVDADMVAELQAAFDDQDADHMPVSQLLVDSPAPIADRAASMVAVEDSIMHDDSEATPFGTPAEGAETSTPAAEPTSDEDESDDDEDSPDVIDEDAAEKAAERAQQLEEVADLEREVERARRKVQALTNQLLRQREQQKLAALEEDLRVKKSIFGLDTED